MTEADILKAAATIQAKRANKVRIDKEVVILQKMLRTARPRHAMLGRGWNEPERSFMLSDRDIDALLKIRTDQQ